MDRRGLEAMPCSHERDRMGHPKSGGTPAAKANIDRARDLIPTLKARAVETETLHRIPDETIADLRDTGLHCYFTPKRYGGWEMDWPVQYEIGRLLAQDCRAAALKSPLCFS